MMDYFDISPEVSDALAAARPVVALESTLIAHGLPYPRNMEVAAAMAERVRAEGAVPAVIGIVGGRIKIGLNDAELDRIARGDGVLKVSRRDLAHTVSAGLDGGTTVAATMICARHAGIDVFATGGIGGVHRGYGETMDVSADLEELGRTRVAVVCAGAKAILDLPRTLEYLETRGVPVVCFGTDSFPAFYMGDSGLGAPCRLDTPRQVAGLIRAQWALLPDCGVLVAQPAPPGVALDRETVEAAIAEALKAAEAAGISGKETTPFLLDRIAESTGGDSMDANAALVVNNASLAAGIAHELVAASD